MFAYIHPQNFDYVVRATLLCASQDMDNEEELEHPNNAIKLGHDLGRIAGAKRAFAIKTGSQTAKQESEDFIELMKIEWSTKVTKLARITLNERRSNMDKSLPEPEDIAKLHTYIRDGFQALDLKTGDYETYRKAATLLEAKLIMYNRRRSGELQALRWVEL